ERAGMAITCRDLLEELGRVHLRRHVAVLGWPAEAELATLARAPAVHLALGRYRARVLHAGVECREIEQRTTRTGRIAACTQREECQHGNDGHALLHVCFPSNTCS